MGSLRVVDISKPSGETTSSLFEAATLQGFLFIDGHDFSQLEVDELYAISQEFFCTVPAEVKQKYSIRSNNIGYTDFCNENLDPRKARDYKEGYNFGNINFEDGTLNRSIAEGEPEDSIPPYFKDREVIIQNAVKKLHANARKILGLLAISLKVEDVNFFVERFRPAEVSGTVLRFLRYPLIRESDLDDMFDPTIRAGAHTDYGALTMLFQRQGEQGLQLQVDGENWTDVDFVASTHPGSAPPFIVNIGDLMSYWTNGLLKSTIHRVKFSPGETRQSDRYSIVFFVHPENDSTLIPVPSKYIKQAAVLKHDSSSMTASQYLQKRLAETYQHRIT
ncbi:hypothetical protein HG535_0C03360 [Zygotorulaspora mrakii]|uniref:Fe2OG dioxygenase domain-containing protein n=1 Tax=Zygotorulaspora mrakii TaxID=42260 RepID=A0A7H9B0G0_ZYGMR|nr:uncharacterized protein HG535_0C03360 [Zygotorulaspora mrakii]QLG71983.1 hypothetical protein HG535_0C03360 [Zygotorulaspora mrakii]